MALPGIVTRVSHVQAPAGITTVSPSTAAEIAACTCSWEQLAAVWVSAYRQEQNKNKHSPLANTLSFIVLFFLLGAILCGCPSGFKWLLPEASKQLFIL
jgi:hypothetical protein